MNIYLITFTHVGVRRHFVVAARDYERAVDRVANTIATGWRVVYWSFICTTDNMSNDTLQEVK